ncbi:hypothetical protein DPEC_G00174070 [Dallia pectoralis]|uniref:Uncharacterized protein n=1 Tax=Dallia pectoralis TaxID=75939 RepID=A0ACC2GEB1_DALPE|nr:hypothetical protein DPEC_G00174070 [Dallia pectoralis]
MITRPAWLKPPRRILRGSQISFDSLELLRGPAPDLRDGRAAAGKTRQLYLRAESTQAGVQKKRATDRHVMQVDKERRENTSGNAFEPYVSSCRCSPGSLQW